MYGFWAAWLLWVLNDCGCDDYEKGDSIVCCFNSFVRILYWATICDLSLARPLWIGIKDKPFDELLVLAGDNT